MPGSTSSGDGEQSRPALRARFLEYVEALTFEQQGRDGHPQDRYKAMVPQVVGPLKLKGRVAPGRGEARARPHQEKLKITLPGPMTIVDTGGRPLLRRPREDGDGVCRAA